MNLTLAEIERIVAGSGAGEVIEALLPPAARGRAPPLTATITPPDRQVTSVPCTARRSARISPAPAPRQTSPAARARRAAVGWASASAR